LGTIDRMYRPTLADLSWAAPLRPVTALIIGRPTEDLLSALRPLGVEIRSTNTRAAGLLKLGAYAINSSGTWGLLIVPTGEAAEAEDAADRDASGHLGNAGIILDDWWEDARPLASDCAFHVGDLVRPRGDQRIGTVVKTVLHEQGYDVQIRIEGRQSTYDEDALELVQGDPNDPEFWVRDVPGDAADIALTLSYTKLRYPLSDMLYSFAASKTLFRPYQFVPVLKLLNSPSGRLLIADEVGLGKTIEAGLIWTELEQRERLRRVLVLAPAALVQKWRAEMRRRFDRPIEVADLARVRAFTDEVSRGRDEEFHAVMSIQALRRANDVLEKLQEVNPQFDLVIVDEAHSMRNRGTSTNELGRLLSDWADTLVFLSATPLNLGREDLFNLMNILDAEQFDDEATFRSQLEPNKVLNGVLRDLARAQQDDPRKLLARLDEIRDMTLGRAVVDRPDYEALRQLLDRPEPLTARDRARAKRLINELNTLRSVFTRTRKVDVPDAKAEREAVQIDVEWTDDERDFYNGVKRLYLAKARKRRVPTGFAMQMPLRQAASCIPAMQAMISRTDFDDVTVQIMEDEDDEGNGIPVEEMTAEEYQEVMGLNLPVKHDSKLEALRGQLLKARAQGMRQAMIFSFFKGTLRYLAEQLEPDFSVRVLTGGTKMAEREVIMEDFRAAEFELLLLSQVGSEGLDFEFCNVLVNYDLPWNPMQVEQRIGRLDRFGQQHPKIFIYNMHIPGTVETDIFERLYYRIGLFKESIGELEPILRDELEHWTNELMDPNLTEAQRIQQADRIAVAIEAKQQEVERLGESSALLSTPDLLEIDGMTDRGPTDGRYVGQSEVRRMLDVVFRRYGGSISKADAEGRAVLKGTTELGFAMMRSGLPRQGTMYSSIGHLGQLLRGGEPIAVTFSADAASRHNIELLSSRHPLVALALSIFEDDRIALRRFGYVGVPGLSKGKRFAVRLDLVSTTGIRPRTEFWATGVDLESGAVAADIEAPLLAALAEGTFASIEQRPVDVPLLRLDSLLSTKRRDIQRERLQDNEAMVEGRIQSRRQGLARKIRRTKETLSELRSKGSDQRIVRLHEGRVRNLTQDLEEIVGTLESRKVLTVSSDPVAVLIVEGV
jgi:superfamily II DNA or RNA helicase